MSTASPPPGIRDALVSRRKEIRKRLDVLNGKSVRRMLEHDLGLEAKQLDPFKALVDNLIDEVVIRRSKDSQEDSQQQQPPDTQPYRDQGADGAPPSKKAKDNDLAVPKDQARKSKLKAKTEPQAKPAKKKAGTQRKRKGLSDDEGVEDEKEEDEEEEEEGTGSGADSDEDQETRPPSKKGSKAQAKPAVKPSGGPKYSKQVERLREICKKATIKIPPNLYKRGPAGSEDRMLEALEGLLAKHGLDANSKDNEIKAVKKQVERMRELEGIDTSNIMEAAGRRPRRAAASINFRQIYNQMGEGDSDAEGQEEEDQEQQQQQRGRKGSSEDDGDVALESEPETRGKGSGAGGAQKRGRGAGAQGKRTGQERVEEEEDEGEEENGGSAVKRSRSLSEEPGLENGGGARGAEAATGAAPASVAKSEQSWGSGSEEAPGTSQKDGLEDEGVPTPAATTAHKSPGSGSGQVKKEQRGGRRRAALEDEEEEEEEEEEEKGEGIGSKAAPKKARKAAAAAESDSDVASQEDVSQEEEEESDFNPSEESD